MNPKTSLEEQFAYVFIICQYIETLQQTNEFDDRERQKVMKLLNDLEQRGVVIEDKEPIFMAMNSASK